MLLEQVARIILAVRSISSKLECQKNFSSQSAKWFEINCARARALINPAKFAASPISRRDMRVKPMTMCAPRFARPEYRANDVTQWISESLAATWNFVSGAFSFSSFQPLPEIKFLSTDENRRGCPAGDEVSSNSRVQTAINTFFIVVRMTGGLTWPRWRNTSHRTIG